jgi:hypothetical protein
MSALTAWGCTTAFASSMLRRRTKLIATLGPATASFDGEARGSPHPRWLRCAA